MVNKGLDLMSIARKLALHLLFIRGLRKSHAREARERRHERETARFHDSRGAHRSPISKCRASCVLAAMISLALPNPFKVLLNRYILIWIG